jgi:rhamnosyltransferase
MPRVSLLLRTRNAGPLFSEVLNAIEAQGFEDREIVVVDSGSRDDTVFLARSRGARIVPISPESFTHAYSTNLGFEAARGELVVSLSQDATPADPSWLEKLVDSMVTPDVAAAFGRQEPRDGCFAVERMELERAYPAEEDGPGRVLFSNVNSIVRKDLWRRHRFDENLSIAEDQEWARWAIGQGYRIRYLPEARVYHSHDHSLGEVYRRCQSEGKAMATFAGVHPGIGSVLIGWPRLVLSDIKTLRQWGQLHQLPRVAAFRMAQLLGNYRGARQA